MSGPVLVTSGTGFVGGWCIAELISPGYTVRATVRDLARAERVTEAVATQVGARPALEFAAVDLTTDAGWEKAMHGVGAVLHVASPMGVIGGGDPQSRSTPPSEVSNGCSRPPQRQVSHGS